MIHPHPGLSSILHRHRQHLHTLTSVHQKKHRRGQQCLRRLHKVRYRNGIPVGFSYNGRKRTKVLEGARSLLAWCLLQITKMHGKSQHKMVRLLMLKFKCQIYTNKRAGSSGNQEASWQTQQHSLLCSAFFVKSVCHGATFTVADCIACIYFPWIV